MKRRSFLAGLSAAPVLCRVSAAVAAVTPAVGIEDEIAPCDGSAITVPNGKTVALTESGVYLVTYHAAIRGRGGLGQIAILANGYPQVCCTVSPEPDTVIPATVRAMLNVCSRTPGMLVTVQATKLDGESVQIDEIFATIVQVATRE